MSQVIRSACCGKSHYSLPDSGEPVLVYTYFNRIPDADTFRTTETVEFRDHMLFLVFCDVTGADIVVGAMLDWNSDSPGGAGGENYLLIRARPGAYWEMNVRSTTGGGAQRSSAAVDPTTAGPTMLWCRWDVPAQEYRPCVNGPATGGGGGLDGQVWPLSMTAGPMVGHAAVFEYQNFPGSRTMEGANAVLVVDEGPGGVNQLSDAQLDLIDTEPTVDGKYRAALEQIALAGASIIFQPLPTAAVIAAAADITDGAGNYTFTLLPDTFRLEGKP